MDVDKIIGTAGRLNVETPSKFFDPKVLIACINAEAKIQSAKIIAEAIDLQGTKIVNVLKETIVKS